MKDGSFTHLHFNNPNQSTYVENWKLQPMKFDDIEIPPQKLQQNLQQQQQQNQAEFFEEIENYENLKNDNFANTFGSNSLNSKILKRQSVQLSKFIDLKYNFEFFKAQGEKELEKFKDLTILPNVIDK
ncbi:hypothetical protein KGF54_001474 [Candida jiufengensis]|uniref:uncharacterized protein n=1 Tax=Candida jiufengensis TaxID=497108 RepID=UPI002224F32A|nr:uncharacterized protein KGF54_001474 [Candida jiufengensis]KAI5954913.1 hypothetical protein KGF54_001474 [Candida jiufengensis]